MNTPSPITINGITLSVPRVPRQNEVFTADALSFLARLHREFGLRAAAIPPQEHGGPAAPKPGAAAGSGRDAEGEVERSWRALVDQHLAEPASSFITPRRLGRAEGRIICEGEPLSAGITDFGLHLSRNARSLLAEGKAPFISLLGIESEEELELWQDLFLRAEELLGLPEGAIRAIHLSPRTIGDRSTEDELSGQPDRAEEPDDGAEVTVLARRPEEGRRNHLGAAA